MPWAIACMPAPHTRTLWSFARVRKPPTPPPPPLLLLLWLWCTDSEDFKDLYIVTNKYDCDLYKILNSGQHLTDEHFSWFLFQLLCGLKYVHSAKVVRGVL